MSRFCINKNKEILLFDRSYYNNKFNYKRNEEIAIENQRPLIGVYFVLMQNNKVLLSKCKSGVLAEKYSMIAGHTEKGETVISAIIREAKEEAGIDISSDDLQVVLTMQRPSAPYKGDPTDIIDIFIKATNYSGQIQNNEPEKCEEIDFFDINNLPEQTLPHVNQAIDLISKNQHFYIYEEVVK